MTAAAPADAAPTDSTPGPPWIARRSRWSRRLILLVAGAAAAAALPPVYAVPLLFPAFWLLVAAVETARTRKQGFGAGWWFGFGYFVAGLYWLAWPLTLDLARFGWMIPFAVFGIGAGLAIFTGLVTLAVRLVGWRGVPGALLLAVAWAAGEWLRGHLLTGFPWNLIATAWMPLPSMLQSAALWGAWGLGFLTVLAAALSAPVIDGRAPARRRAGAGLAALALLALAALGGWLRLSGAPAPGDPAAQVEGVRLRIVQGRIDQELKWSAAQRSVTLETYVRLSRAPGFERVTHMIWPETAIAYRLQTAFDAVRLEEARMATLRRAVPEGGVLLTGIVRDDGEHFWNSLQLIDAAGSPRGVYDKHHLVPFGEYVPWRGLLRRLGVEKIAYGRADYTSGVGPVTLAVPGAPPVSPLICYEAIFPGEAVADEWPGWLLNVTNDAWFGTTSGPYQHLAAAHLRTVEQGLPLVRAANTGISAVVDPWGRVVARLGLNRRGVLDSPLPRATGPTPYARWGDLTLAVLLLVALAAGLMLAKSGAKMRDKG